MQSQTLRKFKWYWAWNDHKEEAWLREMAQQGWHLSEIGPHGFYTFAKAEPADMVYQLDYLVPGKQDHQEYLQLFQDAGWEHLGEMVGWQYWRKRAEPGQDPRIYTDPVSKTEKYSRLLGYLAIFVPFYVLFFPNLGIMLEFDGDIRTWVDVLYALFFITFITIWGYAFIRLTLRMRQLKQGDH